MHMVLGCRRSPLRSPLAVGVAVIAAAVGPGGAAFVQDEYVVSGCVDPVGTDAAYAAVAALNFSGLFGELHAATAAGAAVQAKLCAAHRLPACFPGAAAVDAVPLGGSVKGYYLKDEPHANEFKQVAEQAAAIRTKRPGALVFVNMLGSDQTT